MNKYCKFIRDVKDSKGLIWEADKEYLVSYEDDEIFLFDMETENNHCIAISKKCEGEYFKVIEKK